mmetsp:Transcript_23519/g.75310  ORF Transcript_23519/g.75310 Transcript_23519/m.75310 type:complete len:200 (+) Transcript_23519:943-1542(+)
MSPLFTVGSRSCGGCMVQMQWSRSTAPLATSMRTARYYTDRCACSGRARLHCWTRRRRTSIFSTTSCAGRQGCPWWWRKSREPPSCAHGRNVVCMAQVRASGTMPGSPRSSVPPLHSPNVSVSLTHTCSRTARRRGAATPPMCRQRGALRQIQRWRPSTAGSLASIPIPNGVRRGTLSISRSPHTVPRTCCVQLSCQQS